MTMEQVMRAAAVCVVGALLALVLKKGTPSLALLLSIGVAAVVDRKSTRLNSSHR